MGETLRGTLNSAVDENFPRKNPKKAAKANAKNEATLAKGRQEVSGITHRHQQNTGPPVPNDPNYPPVPYGQPIPAGHPSLSQKPPSPQRTATSEQTVPGSWTPEYDEDGSLSGGGKENREREKSRSISKLFKRKPVASKEGELRVTNP